MNKTLINLSLAMLIGMTALVGCGRRTMPTTPDEEPTPAPVATATPTPEPQVTPTPQPTVAPVTARLSASVTSKKNGSLFGIGAYVVTVDVGNDSNEMLSGELRVQFINGSKTDAAHLKTLQVTLQGGEHQSFSFEDKTWGIDDATVEVVTQNTQAAYTGYGAQYGNYNYNYR